MMRMLSSLLTRAKPVLAEAGPRDAAAIAALHAHSFRRGWSEPEVEGLLTVRNVVSHCALLQRKLAGRSLAGFIMSRLAADEAEILSVAIAKSQQGRGLARDLLTLHLRRLAGLGTHAVFLEVGEENTPATRLYARAGFHEVARRANYYDDGTGRTTTALVLRRDLI